MVDGYIFENGRKERFILPGELYFGDDKFRVSTFLGSCVAISLWHPRRHIGGLCHYKLPTRPGRPEPKELDGSYGDEALAIFLQHIQRQGTRPQEYDVGIFGGGIIMSMEKRFPGQDIGARNIEVGRRLLKEHGFSVNYDNVGGRFSRRVSINLANGEIELRQDAID